MGHNFRSPLYHLIGAGLSGGLNFLVAVYSVDFEEALHEVTTVGPFSQKVPNRACLQGAVSVKNHDKTVIWTSSSYGAVLNSHLHTCRTTQPIDRECPEILEQNTYLFPPGLEDLHIEDTISPRNRFMWMQTEFGTRQVFAVPLGQLLRRL